MRPPSEGNHRRKTAGRLFAACLFVLCGIHAPANAADASKVLRVVFNIAETSFDPPQTKVWQDHRDGANSPWSAGWSTPPPPPGNTWTAKATFSEPGTYVLRALASDGGLIAYEDVTVTVVR
jgi:hypothetical protein